MTSTEIALTAPVVDASAALGTGIASAKLLPSSHCNENRSRTLQPSESTCPISMA